MEIRNIAIIAHVDHGKTTLTDSLLRQTGVFEAGQSMDTYALEKERGITIYAKNTATFYPSTRLPDGQASSGREVTKINIIDTPGHADFGSEVERVLRSIDCVLLIVDAQEGPMPQTRFVLKKSLELGLRPIVVINKIDKPAARPEWAEEEVLGLFLELGATNEQANFPVCYAIGKTGVAKRKLTDESDNLNPLLDLILEHVKPAPSPKDLLLRAQPFNLAYDNYLGRQAVMRIYEGVIKMGQTVYAKGPDGKCVSGRVTKLFSFKGMGRVEESEAGAGDIVMIAGIPDVYIGDTICESADQEILPAIMVDEPTITLMFMVNDSPLAGREGKLVTNRQIRERLKKELEVNVGLKINFDNQDRYEVCGRGELHISILLENMRREGYEVGVSQPQVIIKEEEGQKLEPFEEAIIDVAQEFSGLVIETLGKRKGVMKDLVQSGDRVRLTFEVPTRGILGFRNQFLVDTKGGGIFASRVIGFKPCVGDIDKRSVGSMVSMISGKTTAFSLDSLQRRGTLYVGAAVEVYEGMVIGNVSKNVDLAVNPVKGKHLTNFRTAGGEDSIILVPPFDITIERGLEVMAGDELLEVTPKSVRLRKENLIQR